MSESNAHFTTPVGRIVDGNPWKHFPAKDPVTQQPKIGKDGQPINELYFGLAIPKNSPAFNNEIWPMIYQVAAQAYPGMQLPGLAQPGFAWKIDDGDDPKYQGQEGKAGCWILRLKTRFQDIRRVNPQGQDLMDETQLKVGDYVDVYVGVNCQGQRTNPSIFLNPKIIRFNSYGEAIVSAGGADPSMMAPAQQAVGSTTPIGGQGMAAPNAGGQPPMPQQQQYGAPPPAGNGAQNADAPQTNTAPPSPTNPHGAPDASHYNAPPAGNHQAPAPQYGAPQNSPSGPPPAAPAPGQENATGYPSNPPAAGNYQAPPIPGQ